MTSHRYQINTKQLHKKLLQRYMQKDSLTKFDENLEENSPLQLTCGRLV